MKPNEIKIFCIASILILLSLLLYFFKFHGPLSSNSSDWSNFASFISLHVNVASLILIGYVSYLTYQINIDAVKISENSMKISEDSLKVTKNSITIQNTPVLDIISDRSINYPNENVFSSFIVCLSNCAARNIHIRMYIKYGGEELQTYWILMNCIVGNTKIELSWLQRYSRLEICYTDSLASDYYLYSFDTIRGCHIQIEQDTFERMTKKEGYVITFDDVNNTFKNCVNTEWRTSVPNYNLYIDFIRKIENNYE
jgi:hypothetical protein